MRPALRVDAIQCSLAYIAAGKAANIVSALDKQFKAMQKKKGKTPAPVPPSSWYWFVFVATRL
jgi:hypothetical protein